MTKILFHMMTNFISTGCVLAGLSHLHLLLSLLNIAWWAAYKDRSHSNYENVLPETMYFATPRWNIL